MPCECAGGSPCITRSLLSIGTLRVSLGAGASCVLPWEPPHCTSPARRHCSTSVPPGAGASPAGLALWELVHYMCPGGRRRSTRCGGVCVSHVGSALLGLCVFCTYSAGSWYLARWLCPTRSCVACVLLGAGVPVCPTESLGTACSLLGISQSLVSYWELVCLMGLSPTGSQSITRVLLGSVHHTRPAGSQLGAGASHVSGGWLGVGVSHVSRWELMGPLRSACLALQLCPAGSQCSAR